VYCDYHYSSIKYTVDPHQSEQLCTEVFKSLLRLVNLFGLVKYVFLQQLIQCVHVEVAVEYTQ